MQDDPRDAVLADVKTMNAFSTALVGLHMRVGHIEREQAKIINRLDMLEHDIARLLARYRE